MASAIMPQSCRDTCRSQDTLSTEVSENMYQCKEISNQTQALAYRRAQLL